MIVKSGRANKLVTIEQRTTTETATGITESWTQVTQIWGYIQKISSKAIVEYRKVNLNAKMRVFLRESHNIDNPENFRLVIDGKYYEIVEIYDNVLLVR